MSLRVLIGLIIVITISVTCGYAYAKGTKEVVNMKTLKIKWQRLVDSGETCPRCGSTEKELEKVVATLRQSFSPLGIEVVLEKDVLSLASFKKDPSQSNRIWINNRPLETWLNAEAGQSKCCDVCGDAECRTVEIEGQVYEAIPANVIIKAGLVAASQLLSPDSNKSDCKGEAINKKASGGCCSK